jgi:hypothetical protein
MTKLLLAALVAGMLALTGLVAYNNLPPAATAPNADVATATEDDSCPACSAKESCTTDGACTGCPLGEKGGCCQEAQLKSPCCGGDAAVKPGAKAEAKKE